MSTLIATSNISSSSDISSSEIASLVGQRIINLGGRLEIKGIATLGYLKCQNVEVSFIMDLAKYSSLSELGQEFIDRMSDYEDISTIALYYKGIYDNKKSFHIMLTLADTSLFLTVSKKR